VENDTVITEESDMKIEIWSDFACPYCYLGDRKLALALNEFEHKDEVEISYKSFQLDVHATSHADEDISELIAKKYGISYEQAKASNNSIIIAAKKVGLNYDFDALKPNNTGLAHQVSKYALSSGKEKELVARFFKAYFEEGMDLGVKENLISLGSEVGLDPEGLVKALDLGTYSNDVMLDQKKASELGIRGVPYFVVNDKYAVSGAQSIDYFKSVLDEVYSNE
jgi:predicted DsbA family dithiol-disulfide isomerase